MIMGKKTGLRSIEKKDLLPLLEWRNNPEHRKFFREYRELNEITQIKWYENLVIKDPNTIMFSIVDVPTSELLGACGLCYINWISKNADFSIYLGKNNLYIDNVLAPDAAKILINYAFHELGLHRLWAEVYDFDQAKIRLLRSLGFRLDGTHRETYWHNNKWHDSLFYSLLQGEFDGIK